ncbi:efflux transporter outer membrane subunit [Rhodocyclus tenuis]|uniref:NodT family efflux transporter outer membrane factor (OMF) lipoprotein n=1 Tax=Rhodocyclus tenuis TaxID=1066 RepID=A0A840G9N6_RHOTE|nr:efflux transporter outer membrane subunit [Rhodocyclus tenuis]MBB4248575.1 NodT family efflux transporter outer membrane factor (OMF) lipoprotein [Rhodocyclus tenuis]
MPYSLTCRRAWPALGALLTLAGCAAVGPDYVPPVLSKTELPGQWTSPVDAAATTKSAESATSPAPWWGELSDPALDRLVDAALATSPTLEAALARLAQARASTSQAAAAGSPALAAGANSQRSATDSAGTTEQDSWLSTNASWEIDLFGSVRRGKEGARAREAAQRASLADARVSLAADVTDAYLSDRACQSHLALSEQDVASRQATEKLTAASVEVGFTAPYQGVRSKASVAEARTRLAATRAQCDRLENLLTRLTGVDRPTLITILADKPTGLDRLPEPKHFSVAIPRAALMQRPDVRAAERKVAAASADIGLAEADRYPRLALNGSLGYAVDRTSGSGSLSFGTWSFGPSLSLPILDGGRRKAAVELARSRYDEALADFKAKARAAIQEIEDALSRYAAAHERAETARVSASQYQRFFDAVELRYREGASNLLELEDARRAMLDAQQTLLGVRQERLQAWVALNRATGGAAQYEEALPIQDSSPTASAGSSPLPAQAASATPLKTGVATEFPVH